MRTLFDRFVEHRKMLRNVTPKTLTYYQSAWNAWGKHLPAEPNQLTQRMLDTAIVEMRKAGLSPVSVNCYLCALKTFLKWLEVPLKVEYLKEPEYIPRTFTSEEIDKLMKAAPQTMREKRIQLAIAVAADIGVREKELLRIQRKHVDLDRREILIELGKGQKSRLLPFSPPLRRRLWERIKEMQYPEDYIFATRSGTALSERNALRDFIDFAKRLGITGPRTSWHTFRHTMATNWVNNGGDVSMLQRMLGHSNISTTTRYLKFKTSDLRVVQDRLTMLK